MTWNQFLAAMRTGIQARMGGAAQRARRVPQQVSTSTSTQANNTITTPNVEREVGFWESMILDEYGEPMVLTTAIRSSKAATNITPAAPKERSWESMTLDEFGEPMVLTGEPTVLMLIPPL